LIALDTNILVYGLAQTNDERSTAALDLIARIGRTGAIVPLSVFGEFCNACRKKNLMTPTRAIAAYALWADVYECPHTIFSDYQEAAALSEHARLQFFDALIMTVAARAGATLLLSEDMHDGLELAGLTVVNPFFASNAALIDEHLQSSL
jgi:predicted nucleic acid-binding protein